MAFKFLRRVSRRKFESIKQDIHRRRVASSEQRAAERESFEAEAKRQATLRGRRRAKAKFNKGSVARAIVTRTAQRAAPKRRVIRRRGSASIVRRRRRRTRRAAPRRTVPARQSSFSSVSDFI